MGSVALQRVLVALIREADEMSVRTHGSSRPEADAEALADIVAGTDVRALDVLALVARSPTLFDALAQVVQAHRLEERLGRRENGG